MFSNRLNLLLQNLCSAVEPRVEQRQNDARESRLFAVGSTDPLYYHSINRYLWINCDVYGIINVSTDNSSISSMLFTV